MALISLFECVTAVIPVSFLVFAGSGSLSLRLLPRPRKEELLVPSRARSEARRSSTDVSLAQPLFCKLTNPSCISYAALFDSKLLVRGLQVPYPRRISL